jgi:hypothetical protein
MQRWVSTIPNDGIIRYSHFFNKDRILVTSPKALSEVLTTKSYEFIKPAQMREGLGQLLGVGVLLAEGDEHRVCPRLVSSIMSFAYTLPQ